MPTPPTLTGPVTLDMSPVVVDVLRNPPASVEWKWNEPVKAAFTVTLDMIGVPTFVAWAAGLAYTVGSATRVVPLRHPEYYALICKGVSGEGAGEYTPGNPSVASRHYSKAKLRLSFESVPYAVDGSTPFISIQNKAGSQTVSAAGRKMFFADGTPIQADAGQNIPIRYYIATSHLLPTLDDSVVDAAIGCVNSVACLGRAPGTLRFDDYDSTTTTMAGGMQTWNRSLMLAWRAVPWNQTLRPEWAWDTPLKPGGGTLYDPYDLNLLLQ